MTEGSDEATGNYNVYCQELNYRTGRISKARKRLLGDGDAGPERDGRPVLHLVGQVAPRPCAGGGVRAWPAGPDSSCCLIGSLLSIDTTLREAALTRTVRLETTT
jgi:hypothetical protein